VKHNLDSERVWSRSCARLPQLWFYRCPPSKERLIRNFRLWLYAIHSKVGHEVVLWAYSACWALIEPDFEPNFNSHSPRLRNGPALLSSRRTSSAIMSHIAVRLGACCCLLESIYLIASGDRRPTGSK
jgi:hypothetical protein